MRLRISLIAAAVVAVITAGIAAATDVTAVVDGYSSTAAADIVDHFNPIPVPPPR